MAENMGLKGAKTLGDKKVSSLLNFSLSKEEVVYHDNHTAYHKGIALLKKAGFEFSHASMKTMTCYYYHPARHPYLLRISDHKTKKSPIGMNSVIAKVSFSEKDIYLSDKRIIDMIKWAIGEYFLAEPKPSRYTGTK